MMSSKEMIVLAALHRSIKKQEDAFERFMHSDLNQKASRRTYGTKEGNTDTKDRGSKNTHNMITLIHVWNLMVKWQIDQCRGDPLYKETRLFCKRLETRAQHENQLQDLSVNLLGPCFDQVEVCVHKAMSKLEDEIRVFNNQTTLNF